ncbi:MAG: CAP domain-containing protein [Actinomyces massiliensis]
MKTTRILSSVLLAAVAFAAVPAAQATPAVPISGPSSQQGSTAIEPAAITAEGAGHADTILRKVNELRAQQGLGSVTRYTQLDSVAQGWSEQMAVQRSMGHNPSFADQYPSGWAGASENVAMRYGSSSDDVGAQLFDQWYNSPGHYANMVAPEANAVGIGIIYDQSTDTWYATQNFAAYSDPHAVGLTPTADSSGSNESASTSTDSSGSSGAAESSGSSASAAPSASAPALPDPASAAPTATDDPASGARAAQETGAETPGATGSAVAAGSSTMPSAASESAPAAATSAKDPATAAAENATPSGDPAAAAASADNPGKSSLPVTGTTLAIGVVALIAVIAGLVLLFLRRRR